MGTLHELTARLAIPGMPDWTGLLALLLLCLVGIAYLLMPFAVFGLKGRLESIEAQLDEIQAEIRRQALRSPEPPRRASPTTEDWVDPPNLVRRTEAATPEGAERSLPPIPPPAKWPEGRGGRTEPRIGLPGRDPLG